ncbi:box C/D snoRNA protein 1 [Chanos chanos]|uniref:Box C/D snoRNA protein 1 n=1 Tax=Chanos chanos TaxID=29144 RepID=A0A6J2WE71_CHACN|nr:box C/D snoRNA protein 1 [Chanos chanos]
METQTPSEGQADIGSQEKNRRGVKRKISLMCCDVCGTEEAKYRCPNCMQYTCSLSCVKQHKTLSACSGVRDKAAFVPLSQFDEINLLNDYRFLEDVSRLADGARRDVVTRRPHPSQKMKWMTRGAKEAKITLKFLPNTFTKSRENSTFYNKKERRFYWHLKLLFLQSGSEYTERRVLDARTVEEILSHYIHPTESDPLKRQRLRMYVHTPVDDVRVFMRAEEREPSSKRFHQFDVKKSLRDNLMCKTVIEYPVLHVVLKDHCQAYLTEKTGDAETTLDGATREESVQGEIRRPQSSLETLISPKSEPMTTTGTVPTAPESLRKKVKITPDGDEEEEEGEIRSNEDEDSDGDNDGRGCDGRTAGGEEREQGLNVDRYVSGQCPTSDNDQANTDSAIHPNDSTDDEREKRCKTNLCGDDDCHDNTGGSALERS